MTALCVRREKAALSSGREPHPANAPAGSNRSSHGGDEMAEAQLHRKTRRDRMRAKLKDIKAELRRRMHQPIPSQGRWLKQVVTGHFAYYAVPTNSRALSAFRHYVTDLWRRALRRRSQKDGFTWKRSKIAAFAKSKSSV